MAVSGAKQKFAEIPKSARCPGAVIQQTHATQRATLEDTIRKAPRGEVLRSAWRERCKANPASPKARGGTRCCFTEFVRDDRVGNRDGTCRNHRAVGKASASGRHRS